MEVYRSECREIIIRFVEGRITSAECIAALDSAIAGIIPNLTPDELPIIQQIMAETYERLAQEIAKRCSPD